MKGGTQAAMALAVGYMLGRRRKLRRATIIAVATAAGGMGASGTLVKRGAKVLGSTDALGKVAPQLGELADTVRGDLVSAGKAAATAALSNRVDALTDSLHERSERLRNPGAAAGEAGEAVRGTGEKVRGGVGGARRRIRPEDEEAEDVPADEYDEEESRSEAADYDDEEAEEPEEPEEPEERPARRRTAGRGRSPVARTRR